MLTKGFYSSVYCWLRDQNLTSVCEALWFLLGQKAKAFLLIARHILILSFMVFLPYFDHKRSKQQTNKWTQTPQNTMYMKIYLNFWGTAFHSFHWTFQTWLSCESASISSSDYILPNQKTWIKMQLQNKIKVDIKHTPKVTTYLTHI